jgi:hypothetical protein
MNQFGKDDTGTTIQRTVPDLPRVMLGFPRPLRGEDEVKEEPQSASRPPPCPLEREEARICDFRPIMSGPISSLAVFRANAFFHCRPVHMKELSLLSPLALMQVSAELSAGKAYPFTVRPYSRLYFLHPSQGVCG